MNREWQLVRPRRAREGDTVAVVSPSDHLGRVGARVVQRNGRYIEKNWGIEMLYMKNWQNQTFDFMAGTPEERMDDLEEAILSDARVVWATGGGFDGKRTLEVFDARKVREKIREDPPIFIGYSDICLHLLRILAEGGGSVMAPTLWGLRQWTRSSVLELMDVLSGESVLRIGPEERWETWGLKGKTEGRIVASNLSVLTHTFSSRGDALAKVPGPKILMLEEYKTPKDDLMRWLDIILDHEKIDEVKAVVWGRLRGVNNKIYPRWGKNTPLKEELVNRLNSKGIMTAFLPELFGHTLKDDSGLDRRLQFGTTRFLPIPNGVLAELVIGGECSLQCHESVCR